MAVGVEAPVSKMRPRARSERRLRALGGVARALLAMAAAAGASACAAGQVTDLFDSGGECTDTACADANGVDAAHHDGASGHDAGIDATPGDASAADTSQLDVTSDTVAVDASLDSAPDSAPDSGPDSAPDSSFDAGPVCGVTLSSSAQRYGNVSPLAMNSTHAPNDLLGMPVTIAQAGTLLGFGAIGRAAGPHMVLSLYSDVGGRPSALVAQTPSVVVCVGDMEISATSQPQVPAGNYWILGVFDVTASIGINLSATAAQVDWISLPFGQPVPVAYPSSSNRYTGQSFNYYVVVQ